MTNKKQKTPQANLFDATSRNLADPIIDAQDSNSKNILRFPQEPLWRVSIQAVKDSINFKSLQEFQEYLNKSLPFNSEYTRQRYANGIINRYFSNPIGLNNIASVVWKSYYDEFILEDVMRYLFLKAEPLVAKIYVERIFNFEPGSKIYDSVIHDFLKEIFSSFKKKVQQRVTKCLIELDYLQRLGKNLVVNKLHNPDTALFILLHYLFASSPKTISIVRIIQDDFWKFLGIRTQDHVRKILRKADVEGLISKYILADHLEQITTKYSLDEILELKPLLL